MLGSPIARNGGNTGRFHRALSGRLVSHDPDRLRRRTDEVQPGGDSGFGEISARGQKTVAWMDGIGSESIGAREQFLRIQVGLGRGMPWEAYRFVKK